jgi:hypothetical protein
MSGAGAILRLRLSTIPRLQPRSPLSRTAGEGSGVRAALTFPPAPFLSHAAGAEGGGWQCLPSCWLRSAFTRGAEGGGWRPHLPPSPLPLPRCGSGRGRVAVLTFVLTPFRFHTGSGRGRVAVLTFVLAPFRFHTGSGRGRMERERKHVGIPHAMVAQVSCFMLQRNDTEYIRAGTTLVIR